MCGRRVEVRAMNELTSWLSLFEVMPMLSMSSAVSEWVPRLSKLTLWVLCTRLCVCVP